MFPISQKSNKRIISEKISSQLMESAFADIDAEVVKILDDLEKVQGTEFYQPLLDKDLLCGQKQWVRVLREVAGVNKDFQNLRTYIAPVTSFIGVFHYLIYPADGAMADQPLCGRILIPKAYPLVPPVVHLFTKTNRFNVDAYYMYTSPSKLLAMHSSMCFDILRSQSNGGTWKPEFTLSALMASLIQAIVCIKVPQEDGDEIDEFVSMEKLDKIHQNIKETFDMNKKFMPMERKINKIEAVPVKSTYLLTFDEYITSRMDSRYQIVTSDQPIRLQMENYRKDKHIYTIGFDLSDLKSNPYTVFSVVLSNNPKDPLGKSYDTVLVRNGVTATAAKKRKNQNLKWFYHGKPLNQENLKIIVTIGYDQFCMSYFDENGKSIVMGDCPVSFLTTAEIGRVRKETFYLSVVMKNKDGKQITVRTFYPESGFLHPVYSGATITKEDVRYVKKLETKEETMKIETFGIKK